MYIRVKRQGYWGYIDPNTQKTIDCKYHQAYNFEGGLAIVRDKSGKCGVIDADSNIVIPFEYSYIERETDHCFRVLVNELSCLINTKGIIIDESYNEYSDNLQSYAAVQKLYDNLYIVAKNGKLGTYSSGREVVDCQYYSISPLDSNYLIVKESEYGNCGLLNANGDIIVPVKYHEVGRLNTKLFYGKKYGWGFYSSDGELKCHIDNGWGKIKSIEPLDGDTFWIERGEGSFKANLWDGVAILKSNDAEIRTRLDYDYYGTFHNGICEVGKNNNHRFGFGLIDSKGNELVPCEFDQIDYNEKYALLKRTKSRSGYYSSETIELFSFSENKIISTKEYKSISLYKDGFAALCDIHDHYSLINPEGIETISFSYGRKIEETDDPAIVCVTDYSGPQYYKKTGEQVFKNTLGRYTELPSKVQDCSPFSEGLALVKDNSGKEGYINDEGTIVIPCKFGYGGVSVSAFSGGFAKVSKVRYGFGLIAEETGDYCFIDKNGDFVVTYDKKPLTISGENLQFIFPFEGEVARAIDSEGHWGLIAPNGKRIINFEYNSIQPFQGHYAIVDANNKEGVINDKGTCVIPVKFAELRREEFGFVAESRTVDENGRSVAKECLLDENGHFVISDVLLDSALYDECEVYEGEFIKVRIGILYGLLDLHGKLIAPCEYSVIGHLENGYVHCKGDSKSVLFSPSGDSIELPTDTLSAKYYSGGIVFIENEQRIKNIITSRGGQLLKAIDFDVIDIRNNIILYSKSNYYVHKQGAIDIIGNEIVPCVFNSLHFDDIPNSFVASYDNDDYQQRYDTHGNKVAALYSSLIILDKKYFACRDYHEGVAAVATGNDQHLLWGYVDHTGNEIIKCKYTNAFDFSCGLAKISDRELRYGFINKTGDIQIPIQYYYASDFVNGYASTREREYNSAGIIDFKGDYVISPDGYQCTDVFYDGLARVKRVGLYGYLNEKGQVAIPFVFKSASQFIGGLSEVTLKNNCKQADEQYIIDIQGSIVVSDNGEYYHIKVDLNRFTGIGPIHNGIVAISYEGKWGIINTEGVLLVEPVFKSVYVSPSGDFGIKIDGKSLHFTPDGKYLVDGKNNIIPLSDEFHIVSFLCDGRYIVESEYGEYGDGKGVINGNGTLITECNYDSIELTSDKKHYICERRERVFTAERREDYEVMIQTFNLDGEQVILDNGKEYRVPGRYDSCKAFLPNGLAPVKKNGKWGFINKSVEEIIECNYIEYTWLDDRYCVLTDGKWNKALVSSSGSFVLTPGNYERIGKFEEGRAIVTMYGFTHKEFHDCEDPDNGGYHSWEEDVYDERTIDENGRLLIPDDDRCIFLEKQYKWYIKNSDGTLSVYDGKHWGLLDKNYKVFIPCLFNKAFHYSDSLAVVDSDNGTGVIDISQKVIVGLKYEEVVVHPDVNIIYAWQGVRVTVFNTSGEKRLEIECREIYPLSKEYSKFRRNTDEPNMWKGSKCGFISHTTGGESFGYDDIGEVGDGLISVKKDQKWGYVDLNGNVVIPYTYLKALPFHHGKALVSNTKIDYQNLWGLIGTNGSVILPFVYQNPQYVKDTDYLLIAASYKEIRTYLHNDGFPLSWVQNDKLVALPGYFACGRKYNRGRQLVYGKKGIGIVDESGKVLIKCRDFGDFVDGPFFQEDGSLEIKHNRNKLRKELDAKGRIITIKDGKKIPLPFQYTFAKEWTGDYLSVMIGNCFGIVDSSLKEVIPCKYKDIFVVKEKAVAQSDSGYIIIDLINKEQIELKYDVVSGLSDDYLLIQKKETATHYYSRKTKCYYGVIDLNGNIVIDTTFDEISAENPNNE